MDPSATPSQNRFCPARIVNVRMHRIRRWTRLKPLLRFEAERVPNARPVTNPRRGQGHLAGKWTCFIIEVSLETEAVCHASRIVAFMEIQDYRDSSSEGHVCSQLV